MKKIFLLSIMLFSVLFVNAQKAKKTAGERAQNKVERMTKQLDLTETQQSQLYDIYATEFAKTKTKKKGNEMSKEELKTFKAERKAARADFQNQVTSVLTDEQLAKYETMGKQRSKKGKGKGEGKVKPAKVQKNKARKNVNQPKKSPEEKIQKRVNRMTEKLGLNERQQTQMTDLYASRTPKVKGQAKKELSKEERQAMKEDRKLEQADFEAALSQILTPAQLETYQKMGTEKKGKKSKKGKRKNK